MDLLQAVVLAIVEGLTEFLPVSSTGHMIIASSLMGIASDEFVKLFTVSIQLGSILSVLVLYWRKFLQSFDFYKKLFIAFLPAAIMGFMFGKIIDSMLESVLVVAISLLVGGIVLVFIDKWFDPEREKAKEVSYLMALTIGIFQCLALVPGVSRSAATIIGGIQQGLTRKMAAEFSFFLAVPTMFAATLYKLAKSYHAITADHINILLIGNLVAFIVAMLAIRFFIGYLTRHGFRIFGYYRIVLGLVLLVLIALKVDLAIL